MSNTIFIVFILSLSLIISCDYLLDDVIPQNELDKLPPITTTGENTFGCLVNGKALLNTSRYEMHAIYQGGGLQFGSGVENQYIDQDVSFILINPLEAHIEYDLTQIALYRATYRVDKNQTDCRYDKENTFEGSLIFSKIDRTNFIISGTFEFSTVTDECDTVRITDGRFDMQYTP